MEPKKPKEICKSVSLNACPSLKRVELDEDDHLKKFITWENKSNICWLDASMALVAHNKVMKRYSGVSPECRISKIISAYDEAITILNSSDKSINQKINLARGKLNNVQESTLRYLQPILKYKTGDPESAFCSLYNLLIQDSVLKHIFDVTWISSKECTDCKNNYESTKSKPVITLSKIDLFDPENPAVVYHCACNKSDQKIRFIYVSLPPCLIFHFENGAGKEKPPLRFITRKREYHLTGIMTLEKSQDSTVNHFITWVRDPSADKWLDCNDLNPDIISFSPDFPDINFQDVYMYVYESFDDLGTITDNKIVNTKKSEENIPCIDLSEESDTENSNSQSTATKSNKEPGKWGTSESDLKSDNDKSLERLMLTDKNIPQATQNFKNTSYKTDRENLIDPEKVTDVEVPCGNIETDKNSMLSTSFIVNKTPADGNDRKEMNENICISEDSENNVKTTKSSSRNICSFLCGKETGKKTVSSVTEDKHANVLVKYDTSLAESETLFQNKKEQNLSKTSAKNIQNKEELESKKVCSNTVDEKPVNPQNLGSAKIKDLIQAIHSAETAKKEETNSSEQLFINPNAGQNNQLLAFNSKAKQQTNSELFLSHAAANSSEPSYVKVSVRRKKQFNNPLYKKNFMDRTYNPDSDEKFDNTAIDAPSSSKSLKRKRVVKQEMAEDFEYVPNDMPKKKQQLKKVSNVKRDVVITKENEHCSKANENFLKGQLKKNSQIISKSNCPISKKTTHVNHNSSLHANKQKNPEDFHELLSEQGSQSRTIKEAENSKINSGNGVKILKDFEDVWSHHKSGCNCDNASSAEIIDVGVDFTFAYLCNMSRSFKSNSH